MSNATVVLGLGFGDEGKGSIVDYLCENENTDLVVKFCGGHQCGHTVVRDGRRHIFSQFGSGTLLNIPTYLDKNFIVDIGALHAEAEHLKKIGINNPLDLISIHPRCLITTYYHRALNRAKCKGKNCSVGTGIGETKRYALANHEYAIYFEDIYDHYVLREKIKRLANDLQNEYWYLSAREWEMHPDSCYSSLLDIGSQIEKSYPPNFQNAVLEGSQGTLLDEWKGFYPYNTWCTTTGKHAIEFLDRVGCGPYEVLGVTRCYTTRHGEGPLPTETNELKIKNEVPDNEYQGPFRVGWFDFPLFEYALASNEIDNCPITTIAITCVDHINSGLKYCYEYDRKPPEPPPYNDLDWSKDNKNELIWTNPIYKECNVEDLLDTIDGLCPISISSKGNNSKNKEELWQG